MKKILIAVAVLVALLEFQVYLPPVISSWLPNFSPLRWLKSKLGIKPKDSPDAPRFTGLDDEQYKHFDTGLLASEFDENNPLHYRTTERRTGYALAGSGKANMKPHFLQKLYTAFSYDSVYPIWSGFRSWLYNKFVGGAKFSDHMDGVAADVGTGAENRKSFILAAVRAGLNRVGVYPRFIHVSDSDTKHKTVWAESEAEYQWIISDNEVRSALKTISPICFVYPSKTQKPL